MQNPRRVAREHIHLERQSLRRRLQLPDQKDHLLVDARMRTQVSGHIRTEHADVREPAAVAENTGRSAELLVVLGNLRELAADMLLQVPDLLPTLKLLLVRETDRLH